MNTAPRFTDDQLRRLDAYIARERAARTRIGAVAAASFRTWVAHIVTRFIPSMWSRIHPAGAGAKKEVSS